MAICYHPDGSPDPHSEAQKCDAGYGTDMCCWLNMTVGRDICTFQGLCIQNNSQSDPGLYMDSCADQNWGPGCSPLAGFCNVKSGYEPITQCEDNTFCCGLDNTTCCDAGHGKLLNPHGQLISANLSTSTTARTATITATTTPTNPTPNRDSKVALRVGLGVALPLFVAVLVIGALLYLRRKNAPQKGLGSDSDEARGGSDPDNEARGELEEQHNPHELKGNSSAYELTAVVHEAELDVQPATGDERE